MVEATISDDTVSFIRFLIWHDISTASERPGLSPVSLLQAENFFLVLNCFVVKQLILNVMVAMLQVGNAGADVAHALHLNGMVSSNAIGTDYQFCKTSMMQG